MNTSITVKQLLFVIQNKALRKIANAHNTHATVYLTVEFELAPELGCCHWPLLEWSANLGLLSFDLLCSAIPSLVQTRSDSRDIRYIIPIPRLAIPDTT